MIVIDASVANKLFLPHEADYEKANLIFANHIRGLEEIVVPDLIFYEITNTLSTKSTIPHAKIAQDIADLYKFNLKVCYPSQNNLTTASRIAKELKVSVYDATYAVLAMDNKCNLITADQKFASTIDLPFVKTLSTY